METELPQSPVLLRYEMGIVLRILVNSMPVLEAPVVIQNPLLSSQAILSVPHIKKVATTLVAIQHHQIFPNVSSEFVMLSHKKMEPWKQEKNIPSQ